MKTTKYQYGHRWTNGEIKQLMALWVDGLTVDEIASALETTRPAISKMIVRLRKNGIPLPRRTKGNIAGRAFKPWTQAEVEYLVRRRYEKATSEEIANELGRTWNAVDAMIGKLRGEGVAVPMRGQGVRRLWDSDLVKSTFVSSKMEENNLVEMDFVKRRTAGGQ